MQREAASWKKLHVGSCGLILDENCENDEMKRGMVAAVRVTHVDGDRVRTAWS